MFLGINMFLALLRTHFNTRGARAESESGQKHVYAQEHQLYCYIEILFKIGPLGLTALNGSIAFIFSVKLCLAVKRNANNKFKCGRMGHGDEVLRFYKNCAI